MNLKVALTLIAVPLPDLLLKPRMEAPAAALQRYIDKNQGKILFTADSAGTSRVYARSAKTIQNFTAQRHRLV